jgi:hypothetical protein
MSDAADVLRDERWRKTLTKAGYVVLLTPWPELATAPPLPPVLAAAVPERRYV